MRFEFATANRILFGSGTVREVPALVAGWGKRAFILTDGSEERSEPLANGLRSEGLKSLVFPITEEPSTTLVTEIPCRSVVSSVVIGSPS